MANFNIKVDDTAVAAFRKMRTEIDDLAEQMKAEVNRLKDTFEEHHEGLGSNSEKIRMLLEELGVTAEAASVPVKKLSRRLDRAANNREDIIGNNPYSGHSR